MKISVCHVIDNLAQGGAQSFVKDLITHSPDSVFHSVCTLGKGSTMTPEFREIGIKVHSCDGCFRFDPQALYRLFRHLKGGEFDVVHAHLAYAQTFTRLFAPLARTGPVISTYHDAPQTYCRDWHMRFGEKLTRPLDNVSVGVSASVAAGFAKTFYFNRVGEMIVINNGIDVDGLRERISTADGDAIKEQLEIEGEPLFLNVGRLSPKKRQRDLIDAMTILKERDREGHLVLVGGGDLEEKLRTRVKRKDVSERVTVTGRVPDVEPYYAAGDVYVHAALYEGWPLTLAEALTAELPVVAVDAPGIRDVVGDAGIFVPPKSSRELADAMEKASAPDRQQRLSEFSRKMADECQIERTTKKYYELYRSLA